MIHLIKVFYFYLTCSSLNLTIWVLFLVLLITIKDLLFKNCFN